MQPYNYVPMNNAIKGYMHRLMQRLGICFHFEKSIHRLIPVWT
jgi:hypothetical protein